MRRTPNRTPDGIQAKPRILLVDDSEGFRSALDRMLKVNGFDVVAAASVNEALKFIGAQTFDVLLSDLHMPRPGDGLTVVSAMRHSNPQAVTLLFTAYPEMKRAAEAILLQADDILIKPMSAEILVKTIREHLESGASPDRSPVEDVASMIERETQSTIDDWFEHVEAEPEVISVQMARKERCVHLPRLFKDLVTRLRKPLPLGTRALVSDAAAQHGTHRREQGYTAAMMVEESRMLQVSIFQTLENNLHTIDFSFLLSGVMAIADEVNSQLAQQMACYIAEPKIDGLRDLA